MIELESLKASLYAELNGLFINYLSEGRVDKKIGALEKGVLEIIHKLCVEEPSKT